MAFSKINGPEDAPDVMDCPGMTQSIRSWLIMAGIQGIPVQTYTICGVISQFLKGFLSCLTDIISRMRTFIAVWQLVRRRRWRHRAVPSYMVQWRTPRHMPKVFSHGCSRRALDSPHSPDAADLTPRFITPGPGLCRWWCLRYWLLLRMLWEPAARTPARTMP